LHPASGQKLVDCFRKTRFHALAAELVTDAGCRPFVHRGGAVAMIGAMASSRRTRRLPLDLEPLEILVVELLHRAEETRGSASELMRDVFRENQLKPRQQKRVRDLFHEVLQSGRLLDRAMAEATPGGIVPALDKPIRVLMARVLSKDVSPKTAAHRLEWVDWSRVAAIRREAREIADPVERLALLGSIPDWLAARFVRDYGDEAQAAVEGLIGRAPTTLRANTLKCSVAELAARLGEDGIETEETEVASAGLRVVTPAQLFRTAAFRDGWFEMQDEASQLVAELVAPTQGGLVLDVCAGAGGKSLALAALMANKGTLWAADSERRRLGDLQTRAKRAGVHNLRVAATPAAAWPEDFVALARRADRILVDAPCSGFGSLRRNPDMRWRASEEELDRLRSIQGDLLRRAAAVLKPRARLIYATCTVLREENQDMIEALMADHPELEPVPAVEILGGERGRPVSDADGRWLATLPHRHGMDGFFGAVLRRR